MLFKVLCCLRCCVVKGVVLLKDVICTSKLGVRPHCFAPEYGVTGLGLGSLGWGHWVGVGVTGLG